MSRLHVFFAVLLCGGGWSSLAHAQTYRLTEVVVPEFVTDSSARGHESGKQDQLNNHGATARWINKNESYFFQTAPRDGRSRRFTVDLTKGEIKVHYPHNVLKDVAYDWVMTFTPPPRVIEAGQTFELKATVKGPVSMDHYGKPHAPYRPCYWSDSRLVFESAGGLGNPVLYQKEGWKWPTLKPNSSDTWSGSAKFHIDKKANPRQKDPFSISIGVPTGSTGMSNFTYLYEGTAADEVAAQVDKPAVRRPTENESGGTRSNGSPVGRPASSSDATGGSNREGGSGGSSAGTNKDSGDFDRDGRFTALDAEAALQMSVGLRPVDLRLDVDRNGSVESNDARIILDRAAGLGG